MKLRCFFGPAHGKWHAFTGAKLGAEVRINDAPYLVIEIAGRRCLMHEHKDRTDVLDWLFTFDKDHPQSEHDDNHPSNVATVDDLYKRGKDGLL